jgi:LysR family nitrogen assimilation transcriptional regulator
VSRPEQQSIDTKRLRYFLAVCDHGGFSKAASAIGVAQPVLTRHVQLLEQELGVSLVSRNGRGASPTEPGRFLRDHARVHLEGLDSLAKRLRQNFKQSPEQVVLGICPTVSPLFLDNIQSFIRVKLPSLTLSVIEAYSGDLRSLMESGRIDFALTYQPLDRDAVDWIDLLSERLVVVKSASRKLAASHLSLHDVSRLALILPSQIHQLRKVIDRVCLRRGICLTPELELDSLSAVKLTLDDPTAQFATILPYHAVREDERAGRFDAYRIDDAEMVRTVSLIRPQNSVGTRLPEALLDHIRDHAMRLKSTLETAF